MAPGSHGKVWLRAGQLYCYSAVLVQSQCWAPGLPLSCSFQVPLSLQGFLHCSGTGFLALSPCKASLSCSPLVLLRERALVSLVDWAQAVWGPGEVSSLGPRGSCLGSVCPCGWQCAASVSCLSQSALCPLGSGGPGPCEDPGSLSPPGLPAAVALAAQSHT